MTDLPKIRVELPPAPPEHEDWYLRMANLDDPNDDREATLEDVRAVLDAAGYVVAKKADFKFTAVEHNDMAGKAVELRTTEGKLELYETVVAETIKTADTLIDALESGAGGTAAERIAQVVRELRRLTQGDRSPSELDEYDRPLKTSGTPDGTTPADEGALNSRPAERRQEQGTVRGRQPSQNVVPEFGTQKKILEIRFPSGGTPRRATFADLHGVERGHWISLLPCSECGGPVNDKICTSCHEVVEAQLAEARTIAGNAISALVLFGYGGADALRERLEKI